MKTVKRIRLDKEYWSLPAERVDHLIPLGTDRPYRQGCRTENVIYLNGLLSEGH